jgi:hypothetical protein
VPEGIDGKGTTPSLSIRSNFARTTPIMLGHFFVITNMSTTKPAPISMIGSIEPGLGVIV